MQIVPLVYSNVNIFKDRNIIFTFYFRNELQISVNEIHRKPFVYFTVHFMSKIFSISLEINTKTEFILKI